MSIYHSNCPIVRRETATLYERVAIAGEWQFVPFTREIAWLRESETELVLVHRDCVVKHICSMNDFYGFLTSVHHTLREIARENKEFGIQPGDVLTIQASVKITDSPVLLVPNQEFAGRLAYQAADAWYRKPNHEERVEQIIVEERTGILTSAHAFEHDETPPDVAGWVAKQRQIAGEMEEAANG